MAYRLEKSKSATKPKSSHTESLHREDANFWNRALEQSEDYDDEEELIEPVPPLLATAVNQRPTTTIYNPGQMSIRYKQPRGGTAGSGTPIAMPVVTVNAVQERSDGMSLSMSMTSFPTEAPTSFPTVMSMTTSFPTEAPTSFPTVMSMETSDPTEAPTIFSMSMSYPTMSPTDVSMSYPTVAPTDMSISMSYPSAAPSLIVTDPPKTLAPSPTPSARETLESSFESPTPAPTEGPLVVDIAPTVTNGGRWKGWKNSGSTSSRSGFLCRYAGYCKESNWPKSTGTSKSSFMCRYLGYGCGGQSTTWTSSKTTHSGRYSGGSSWTNRYSSGRYSGSSNGRYSSSTYSTNWKRSSSSSSNSVGSNTNWKRTYKLPTSSKSPGSTSSNNSNWKKSYGAAPKRTNSNWSNRYSKYDAKPGNKKRQLRIEQKPKRATEQNSKNLIGRPLDIFVAGFPKCGTTTLLYAFKSHPETDIGDQEQCAISSPTSSDADAFAKLNKALTKLPGAADPSVKTAIKCPGGLKTYHGLKRLDQHSPNARFVIGVRHPVKFFQSFYNYRVTEMYDQGKSKQRIPSVHELIGSKEWKGVSTDNARFELFLMQMGKAPMSVSDRKEFIGRKGMAMTSTSNKVFVYSVEQLQDNDVDRESQFRRDMQEFLQLSKPPDPFDRRNKNHFVGDRAHPETINICDAEFDDVRALLLSQGERTATWIQHRFLSSSDVFVSNKDHFIELLHSWGTDPCVNEMVEPRLNPTKVQ